MKILNVIISIIFIVSIPIFPNPNSKSSLLYLMTAEPSSLDPGKTTSIYTGEVVSNIFEGLVEFSKNNQQLIPCLAKRWESFDMGKRWRFYLRENVFFHDGTPFDSSAVLYSFLSRRKNQESEYPEWKVYFPHVKNIRALDRYTVEITLNKPFGEFLTLLTEPVALIILPGSHKHPYFNPVGTGPFIFEKWEKGKYVTLKKNKRYWNKPVRINKLIFKIISKPEIAINMMKSGLADVMEVKSVEIFQNFLGFNKFILTQSPPGGTFFVTFNTRKYPFNRIEFRKGFAHLIKKDSLIKTIFQNIVSPAITPIPNTFAEFNNKITDYKLSIKKSISLFKKSGIKNGFKCNISYLMDNKSEQRIAETFRKQGAKAGIVLIKNPLPFNELFNNLKTGKFEIALRGWVTIPDPDFYFFPNFTTLKGNFNYGRYSNPELEKLLIKARDTLNTDQRRKIYLHVQDIIHNEVPWIPLYYSRATIIHTQDIKGIYLNSNSFTIFKDAYFVGN